MNTRATVILLVAALGGCMLGPNYKRPQIDLPVSYPEPAASAGVPVPAEWWRLYNDPLLDKLVSDGLARNTDVKLAVARVEEAEANLREAQGTLLPQINGNVGANRARSINRTTGTSTTVAPSTTRNDFSLSANTSFEIDFWGHLRRLREAVRAQYISTRYARDVVGHTLAAGITQTYFTARSLDAQIMVSDETLKAAIDSVDIARKRAEAGVVSDLDVNQADGIRAQLAAQAKDLRRLRATTVHQLGLLTGTLDLNLEAGDLRRIPAPPLPPAGLPSTLVERRPDVRQAEAALVSANAQIGVARAAQFPTFSFTGALGVESAEFSNLLSRGAGIWSLGLAAVGPIFDSGRAAARTAQAEARTRQAEVTYERTIQTAFREVADALSNVRLAADTDKDLRDRVEQARNALRLANLRYESGYSAYLEVLDAQRTFNDAQLALVRNSQSFLGYTVDLMNALGGGWAPY